MADKDAFDLLFTSQARVGGQVIAGAVVLNIPLLHFYNYQEIHVNLRAELVTRIGSHKEEIHPFHDTVGIWKRSDTAGAEVSSQHVVRKIFSFNLPQSRAPSGKYGQEGRRCTWPANVAYYVDAIGVRLNVKDERRMRRPFAYVPNSAVGAHLCTTLTEGWAGCWKTTEETKALRVGSSWKGFSQAKATVSLELPDIEGFPIDTSIPFNLRIAMFATPRKVRSAPTMRTMQLVGVDITIERDVYIKAHSKETTIEKEFVARVGSFGTLVGKKNLEHRLETKEMPWMPILDDDKEHTGAWKEDYDIASKFVLHCPPSTEERTLRVTYFMVLKITFVTGPDTMTRIPLDVVSNRCASREPNATENGLQSRRKRWEGGWVSSTIS